MTTDNQAPDLMPDTVEDKPRPKAPALAALLLASILVIGVTAAVVMGGGDSKGAIRREADDYSIRTSRVAAPTAPEREAPKPIEDDRDQEKPDPESQRRIEQLAARMAEAERQAQLDDIRREREKALKQQEDARKRLEDRRRSSILVASSASPSGTSATGADAASSAAGVPGTGAAGLDPFAALSAAQAAQTRPASAPAPFAFLPSPTSAAPETVAAGLYGDPSWRINQGKFLHGVLETRISSELPGSVRAVVSRDTYSEDGSQVLVPAGSRLTGEYRSSVSRGQSRIGVIWHRIARPDGVDVLISAPGTDRLGVSGVAGDVDTHWWERFGGSVLLSLIDAYGQDQSNETVSIVASDGGNAAAIALQNSINIPPTITVDQGTEINIFVHQDIDFSQTRITRRP